MNLRYKFIHVGRDTALDEWAGKPIYYIFNTKSDLALGRIIWYAPWRRWVFTSAEDSVWSTDCLADVQDAIAKISREPAHV